MVVDLGTQEETYMGKPIKPVHKVRIGFELPTEKHVFFEEKGEEPFTLSKKYTVSLGEKANLKKELESWRGKPFSAEELKGFEIAKLLGAPVTLTVIHKTKKDGGITAVISALNPLMAQMKSQMPPAINKPILYTIEQGKDAVYQSLPEWIQEEINGAFELNSKPATQGGDATPDDEDTVPF